MNDLDCVWRVADDKNDEEICKKIISLRVNFF